MSSTKEVLDRHLTSFGEHDLKGILSDYASGAVFFTPEGPLKGDEIKAFFHALLAEFGKPGATFSLKHQSIEGDDGYIVWAGETADNVYGWAQTPSSCRMGRSSFSRSPVRSRPSSERTFPFTARQRPIKRAGVLLPAPYRGGGRS